MRIAVDAAGFSPGEADELRRKMGAWRKRGDMGDVRDRLIGGMARAGINAAHPRRSSSKYKDLASTASPRATRSASRSWPTHRRG